MSARLMTIEEVPEEFWQDMFELWNLPEDSFSEPDPQDLTDLVTRLKVTHTET